ncbi:MAG TPA: phage major capsid protein [Terriglobales bacterium]
MAFANSSITDIIATTIQNRSGVLADNTENNNAVLRELKRKGNVRPFGGGNVILEELMYIDPSQINVNSYSGYETLNVGENSPISSAQYSIAQYAGAVTMSGLQMLQNSGKEAIIDLMEGRMQVTEKQLMNRIDYDLYQNGTGNGGKNLTGLAAAIADTPTSGTYGGIDRQLWTFWQNQFYRGVTDGGAAVSAANIQAYLTTLALRCVRGSDMPDLYVGSSNYYTFYVNSLQAIQRITSANGDTKAGAGFPTLSFSGGGMNAKVVLGGGINGAVNTDSTTGGEPTSHFYLINTDYLYFRPHRDRNFVPIGGERQSVNQDAIVKLIGWAGNLTSSGPQFCGVLEA